MQITPGEIQAQGHADRRGEISRLLILCCRVVHAAARNSQLSDLAACHARPDIRRPVLVAGRTPHTSLTPAPQSGGDSGG